MDHAQAGERIAPEQKEVVITPRRLSLVQNRREDCCDQLLDRTIGRHRDWVDGRGELLGQCTAQWFPGGAARQRLHLDDAGRNLMGGKQLRQVIPQLLLQHRGINRGISREDHRCGEVLAAGGMRKGKGQPLQHSGVPVRIKRPLIAGLEPLHPGGVLNPATGVASFVAASNTWPADRDLADHSRRLMLPCGGQNRHFRPRRWTNAAGARGRPTARQRLTADLGRGFGHAIHLQNRHLKHRFQALPQRWWQRHGDGSQQPEVVWACSLLPLLLGQKRCQQGGRCGEPGGLQCTELPQQLL